MRLNRRESLRILSGVASLISAKCCGEERRGEAARTSGMGLVTYTCGHQQQARKLQDPTVNLFDPLTFLDHCRRLGAGGAQVPLGVRDKAYNAQLRGKTEASGMFLEGILSPPRDAADLARFEAEIRTAADAGVRDVRTVVIPGRRYESFDSLEQFRELSGRARKSLELAAPIVEKHRVRLAVENHKDHRIGERMELLRHVSSEFVGVCVDTGNSIALLEDPLRVVESFAPWAFSVHLKDQAVAEHADGFLLADVPLGQGLLDLRRMVDVLRKAKPDVRFCLELITRDPLLVTCLTEKYWKTMEGVSGSELARTLRTVRERAAKELPRVDALAPNERASREEANIKASLVYARDFLSI